MTEFESDDEGDEEDWRLALRSVTGYDASRCGLVPADAVPGTCAECAQVLGM